MFILFDFFGTLVDYEVASPVEHFATSIPLLRSAGYRGDVFDLHARWQTVYGEMLTESLVTLDEFAFEAACARALRRMPGLRASAATDPGLCSAFMHCLLDAWNAKVRPIAGVAEMLKSLQTRHTLALISNTHHAPLVHGNLARFGLREHLVQVFTSVEHGKRKPSAELFQAAMQALGADADACLFVGDNPFDDYMGARAAGMQAWLIDPQGHHAEVPAADKIAHILSVAERLAG